MEKQAYVNLRYQNYIQRKKLFDIYKADRASKIQLEEEYDRMFKPITTTIEKQIVPRLDNLKETPPQILPEVQLEVKLEPASTELSGELALSPAEYDAMFADQFSQITLHTYKLPLPSLFMVGKYIDPTKYGITKIDKTALELLTKTQQQLGGQKRGALQNQESIRAERITRAIEVLQKYKKTLKLINDSASTGKGLKIFTEPKKHIGGEIKYYKNSQELKKRLQVLLGEIMAGNDNKTLKNEATEVLEHLWKQQLLPGETYQKMQNALAY